MALVAMFALASLVALVIASAWFGAEYLTRSSARTLLESQSRTLAPLYATARTGVVLTAGQLAADTQLNSERIGPQRLRSRLSQRISSTTDFAVILDLTANSVATIPGTQYPRASAELVTSLTPDSLQLGYQLVVLDGVIHGVSIAEMDAPERTLVFGSPLNIGSAKGPLPINLSLVTAMPPVVDGHVSLVLDQAGEHFLVATMDMTSALANAQRTHFIVAISALAITAAVLIGVFLWIVLRQMVRGQWRAHMSLLSIAVRDVRNGNYERPLRVPLENPLARIAHEFNAMSEKLAEREHRISHEHQFDSLTGLTNRSVVNERIERAVDKARSTGTSVAAVAIDVSRFNEINGTLGNDVGDQVLKELARRLASNTRVTDTVARVGGDEFLLLLDDADVHLSRSLVEFLVTSLEAPITVGEHKICLALKTGIAMFPDHCDSMKALRRMANIALMTAKDRKEQVVMYEPGQDEQHLRELAIIHDLPGAIRNNELYLQYQPKIEMDSKQVKQVEALVRWRHPQLGFIPPDEFIGLLERAGQISQLTDWVFKEAVRQCREWNDAGYDLGIAVNISAQDLTDENLPERIMGLLRHYMVKPAHLSIEVTESAVIEEPELAVAVLQEFRRHGLEIALDDFGTGQTSLSLLKQLPLSQIKIDKSFVQHLRADSGDAIIVKSIIDLGHNMGLLVTAEGVESNYCWNLLNSYDCDLVQGYLVSAPLTADELREWYLRLQDRHVNQMDYSFIQNAG